MSDNNPKSSDNVFDMIDKLKADDMMKIIEVLEQGLKESDKDADPLGRSDYWQKSIPQIGANEDETVAWLEENIIPVSWPGYSNRTKRIHSTGPIYRAGVMLEGGFFIPCVVFANPHYFN